MKFNRRKALFWLPLFILSALALSGFFKVPDPDELSEEIPVDANTGEINDTSERSSASILYENFTEDELFTMNGENLKIFRDPVSDIPRQIEGRFTTRTIRNEQDALMALLSVRGLMNITDYQFACTETDDDRNDFCVFTLQQLYQNIPVEMGYFRIVADKEGNPVSVSGTYQPEISMETEARLSAKEGGKLLPLGFGSKILSVKLVIYTDVDGNYHLAWRYSIASGQFMGSLEDRIIYLDAVKGEILQDKTTVFQ